MDSYADIYRSEIDSLRKEGHKLLAGEIKPAAFKGFSGGFGVYAQRGADKFMIRLRTPSGVISRDHFNLILSYVKQYDLSYIHLTTRQAIQLHDLSIDDVCDIMEDATYHNLFTRGGGGNYPRNVSLSPLSGVELGEAFDVTQYALLVNEYFVKNASTYHLPRKLKVGFSNGSNDTGMATINDLGFIAVIKDNKPFFKMYLAGGMGGGPAVAMPYPDLIEPEKVLYYVEAMVQMFIAEGDYEHKAKARTRFILRRMGNDSFIECFDKHLEKVMKENTFEEITPVITAEDDWVSRIPEDNCIMAQKQADLYTVKIHPICGILSADVLESIRKFIIVCESPNMDIRLGMDESIYVRNISSKEAILLLSLTENDRQLTMLEQSLSCIGVPTCQMGVLQSQALCRDIITAIDEAGITEDILPSLHISGCSNSCTRHQVATLGFAGKKTVIDGNVVDVFEVHAGGHIGMKRTKMGKILGLMNIDDIPVYIVELATYLLRHKCYLEDLIEEDYDTFYKISEKYLI